MMRRIIPVLIALAAAGCAGHRASTTSTTGTYTTQVDTYLARQAATERASGYTRLVAGPVHGRLNSGATGSHEMQVLGGSAYVVFGQCDNDCTDLDLKIYDPNGSLLLQDVAVDDHPTLIFNPKTSGTLRVEVIMAHCNVNPCFYGLELLARP